jgi:hypothetical protein
MQTRVAVRDKTPHRFQVVPLREILKRPVQLTSSTGSAKSPHLGLGLKSPQRGSSVRRGHTIDESSPRKNKDKVKAHSPGRNVLQDRDINTNSDPFNPTHKKTISLEMSRCELESPQQSPTIASSRGFSQSLNQYTFRLKPWKSYTHLQATPTRKRHNEKSLEDLSSRSHGYPRANSVHSDLNCSPVNADTRYSDSDQYSPGLSPTLVNSAAQLNMSEGSKKRHAIYSHMDILPIGGYNFKGRDSPGLAIGDVFSNPKGTCRTLQPSAPNITSNQLTTGTPPLRLASKPARRCGSGSVVGAMCYPETVLEMLRELDDAIEGWNHSFSGVDPS